MTTQHHTPNSPRGYDTDLLRLLKGTRQGSSTAFDELLDRPDIKNIIKTRSHEAAGYRAVISPAEVYGTAPSLVWGIVSAPNSKVCELPSDSQRQAYISRALKNQYQRLIRTWGNLTYTPEWKLTPKFHGVNIEDVAHVLAYQHTPEDVVIAKETLTEILHSVNDSTLPPHTRDAFAAYVEYGGAASAAQALDTSPAAINAYVRQARAYLNSTNAEWG